MVSLVQQGPTEFSIKTNFNGRPFFFAPASSILRRASRFLENIPEDTRLTWKPRL